ncbi:bifunctional transcriptional activator/DNA repair enzyme AdaA [Roseateles sp.]|uniref:bifunctional transcriptional activator/DNA repair enzyme AdaA n=1 Tax=Roseateles sp. TaxID=1971397 RepID=UPI003BA564DD
MEITDAAVADRYYQALLDRAEDHVGVFFAAVTSTGVFCIASCRARKPKRQNVRFFSSSEGALQNGFRPCKVCRPTEHAYSPPATVLQALQWLRAHPQEKLGDGLLREQGLSPEVLRRWFLRHHGMTFQAYQRQLRINTAVEQLKAGGSATQSAMDAGYDSLSGFGYTFKRIMGAAPSSLQERSLGTILLHRFTTPLGPMFVCATDTGVCLIEFVSRRMLETEFRDLQRLLRARITPGENTHTRQAVRELDEYFRGERRVFEVALDTPGSAFQQSVWQALQAIPFGRTGSYGEQARALGRPEAVRAVAAANGQNRVSIIVPCHRVIGADGRLVGYGGGLARKQWLLEHEARWLQPEGGTEAGPQQSLDW